jgi:hypothetical protein
VAGVAFSLFKGISLGSGPLRLDMHWDIWDWDLWVQYNKEDWHLLGLSHCTKTWTHYVHVAVLWSCNCTNVYDHEAITSILQCWGAVIAQMFTIMKPLCTYCRVTELELHKCLWSWSCYVHIAVLWSWNRTNVYDHEAVMYISPCCGAGIAQMFTIMKLLCTYRCVVELESHKCLRYIAVDIRLTQKQKILIFIFRPASLRFSPETPLYKDISEKNLIK